MVVKDTTCDESQCCHDTNVSSAILRNSSKKASRGPKASISPFSDARQRRRWFTQSFFKDACSGSDSGLTFPSFSNQITNNFSQNIWNSLHRCSQFLAKSRGYRCLLEMLTARDIEIQPMFVPWPARLRALLIFLIVVYLGLYNRYAITTVNVTKTHICSLLKSSK